MHTKRLIRISLLAFAVIVISLSYITVNAASVEEAVSYKKIADAPNNGNNVGNISGMDIYKDHVYYIKSSGSVNQVSFSKILNFRTAPSSPYHYYIRHTSESGKIANIPHNSGLTYSDRALGGDGNFYVPTNKKIGEGAQIVAIDSRGVITKIIKIDESLSSITGSGAFDRVSSITHYKNNQFIIGNGQTTEEKVNGIRKFYLITIDNEKFVFDKSKSFSAEVNANYVAQDIAYSHNEGKLYVPMFYDTRPAKIYKNKIYTFNLASGINYGNQYPSIRTMVANGKSATSTFEVESVAIDEEGKKYICTNEDSNKDKIYQLYRPSN